MIRIVIGTQPNQFLPQRVLEYSIREHTAEEVEILPTRQPKTVARRGGTRFGFVRFLIPQLMGYEGKAIYFDADQLVLGDVRELIDSLDADHAVGVVQQPEGTFAGEPVPARNETSVMVLDCEKLKDWDPDQIFESVVANDATPGPGQIRYKDFMRLGWVDPALIQAIDPRWNHYNLLRDDTRNVHFSHVREQPWKRPAHPLREMWSGWLERAMAAGYVSRGDVLREVARLHLQPGVLATGALGRGVLGRELVVEAQRGAPGLEPLGRERPAQGLEVVEPLWLHRCGSSVELDPPLQDERVPRQVEAEGSWLRATNPLEPRGSRDS